VAVQALLIAAPPQVDLETAQGPAPQGREAGWDQVGETVEHGD